MIKGSIVALITPFDDENKINYNELFKLLDFHINNGTDGLLLLGTTGEPESLTDCEKREFVEKCIDYLQGRIKVMVGLISNIPERVIELSRLFEGLDIDSFLVTGPFYIKSNDSGLIKYFTYIADHISKPLIIYNVPKRTGFNISVEVVNVLSYHNNIIGIKEASGDLVYLSKIAVICRNSFVLYGGDDLTMIPALVMGASGIISVINNAFPKEVKTIIDCVNKDISISKCLFFKIFKLIEDIFIEVSPIPIKYLMYVCGFNTVKLRMPLANPSIELRRKIEEDYLEIVGEE